jgi:hypothetical protein
MIANFLIDSRYGGPHLYLSILKKKNYKVKSLDYFQDKTFNNLNLINLKQYNKNLFFLDVVLNIFIITYKFFKKKKIKTFCVFTIYNIAPIIAAKILNKKIFWFILEKPNLLTFIIFKILNLFIKIKTIVISESLGKQLNINKFSIYFPDIDFEFWNKYPNNLIINEDKKIILTCVCNLNKTKNHLQLLNFIDKIDKKIELNLIGKNLTTQKTYYTMLKKKSFYLNKQQNIKINFLGNKNKNFIRKFYRKTHIYILPSLSEGLSVSLTEAMSSGCICLVSKNSNHSKIISSKNGFIFNLDKKSFLKEFNKIIKMKKKKYNEIRNHGYETVKTLIKHGYNLRENF